MSAETDFNVPVPVSVPNGGTGATTLASNGVLLGNGTSAVSVTAAGSAYQILRVPAGGGAPAFGLIPNFSAYLGTQQALTAVAAKLAFNTELYDNGAWYDPTNSRATAPVAGTYQFGINCYIAGGSTQNATFHLYKNGSLIARITTVYAATGFDYVVAGAVQIELAANDLIEVYALDAAATHWTVALTGVPNTSAFWGRLISTP